LVSTNAVSDWSRAQQAILSSKWQLLARMCGRKFFSSAVESQFEIQNLLPEQKEAIKGYFDKREEYICKLANRLWEVTHFSVSSYSI
jgi:hypothetical protein